jgi:signal transduction histidine kinase
LTSKLGSLHLGDRVDVIGFLNCEEGFPVLEDAQYTLIGKSPVSAPIRFEKFEQAQKHNGALVELDGRILSQSSTAEGCRLELAAGSNRFTALWPGQDEKSTPTTWQPGAVVRAIGICIVASEAPGILPGRLPSYSLKLILRSPADIQILRPGPWWTAARTAWVLGTAVGVLLLVLLGLFSLARQRLRQQALERMKAETEFAAIFNERNRIARELHDTLAQGLGSISLHLDVAKEQRERAPEQAARHLDIAHLTAQESLTEVRNSISNMRSHILENATLAEAVQQILRKLTEDTETQERFTVTGTPRRLAAGIENNLLRLAQEAIGNAVKHAKAKTISVTLAYEPARASLIVRDDGTGFDPEHLPPGNHFGLIGQRERTLQMGGTLEVKSTPGCGTEVSASIPT